MVFALTQLDLWLVLPPEPHRRLSRWHSGHYHVIGVMIWFPNDDLVDAVENLLKDISIYKVGMGSVDSN